MALLFRSDQQDRTLGADVTWTKTHSNSGSFTIAELQFEWLFWFLINQITIQKTNLSFYLFLILLYLIQIMSYIFTYMQYCIVVAIPCFGSKSGRFAIHRFEGLKVNVR